MSAFNTDSVNKLILQKQYLTESSRIDDIIKITENICGLHSTDLATAYLSLFARTNNFKREDLEQELYINRNLGRIRGMRTTLFIITKEIIPVIFAATFKFLEKNLEKYMEFQKISQDEYQNISNSIINILKEKELSALEIRKRLNSKKNIPAIIQILCNNCTLIRTKPIKDWKDRRNNYALFNNYFPDINLGEFPEQVAINLLVDKYIRSYGPVREDDITWWTGLTKSEIRIALKNIENQIEKVKIEKSESEYFIFKSDLDKLKNSIESEGPSINLLPQLDPYIMGYKERGRYIDSENYKYLFDRSGNATFSIILDGKVIGIWDTEIKPEPVIKLHLFNPIEKNLQKELYSKAQKVGEFYLESKIQIKQCAAMAPLSERTAGGFLTPLKNS